MTTMNSAIKTLFTTATLALAVTSAMGDDWPMWGRTPHRNMSQPQAQGLPTDFDSGRVDPLGTSEEIDPKSTRNIAWTFKLGSQSYGNLTVAGGKLFIGTNNEVPRDPKHKGDRGVVMALDAASGKFLWQLVVPKLGAGKVSDWEYLGVCSSPHVDGDRVYVVTNRCEVVAMDVHGLANGNDGPFVDEGQYMAGPGKPAMEVGPTDADILWRFDMREELGVFPHNIASSSVLVVGDRLYASTSNGQDWSHKYIPAPKAPTLVVLDKNTGELLGEEASGISERIYHSGWASPTLGQIDGKDVILHGAGDGYVYAFDPAPVPGTGANQGLNVLKEIWRFRVNPKEHIYREDGTLHRYATAEGPSEVIATPVYHDGKVYVSVGQDPEHGDGVGTLVCINVNAVPAPGQVPDISESGLVWRYTDIGRSISTVSIHDGLLYIAEYAGKVHCMDANTGKVYWVHDTGSHVWASTFVADGKLYIGNEDGLLTILATGKELKVLKTMYFEGPLYATPVWAGGMLYTATHTHLWAIPGVK